MDTIETFPPQEFDDVLVSIDSWIDDPLILNDKENIGMGASRGSYDVYMEEREWCCGPWGRAGTGRAVPWERRGAKRHHHPTHLGPRMTPLNLRTLLPFLLVPALLAPAAPALADTYDSGDCRRPPSGVQCREVSGPGEAFAKGALGLGFMHCSSGGLLPVPCSTSGFGGAYFDVSSWNSHPSVDYAREVYLWVNWVGGEVAPSEPGFDVTFCNDRNDDDVCSMPPHQNYDDIRVVQSNAAVLAPPAGVVPGVDFDDHPCDKDSKDCDDPTDAEMEVCVREDDPMDSGFDNIIVFIGAWVDVGLGGNVGVGTYNGIFEVWMREGGFMDPEECPGFVPDEFVFKPYFVD